MANAVNHKGSYVKDGLQRVKVWDGQDILQIDSNGRITLNDSSVVLKVKDADGNSILLKVQGPENNELRIYDDNVFDILSKMNKQLEKLNSYMAILTDITIK